MQFFSHLAPLAERYDGFILDLWGVVHDGTAPYPYAKECLEQFHAAGKTVILLSNAPRRAENVAVVLERIGIQRHHYGSILSSGDIAYEWLAEQPALNYFFIGPDKDIGLANGLAHRRVETLKDADLIVNVGFEYDLQPYSELEPYIREGVALNLPMICVNPDMDVVKLNGDRYLCAGTSSREYEELGGKVSYFGKPHPAIYEACLKRFGTLPHGKILAIGDTLQTDILGARQAGIDSALITGGVLNQLLEITEFTPEKQTLVERLCQEKSIAPNYVLPWLRW